MNKEKLSDYEKSLQTVSDFPRFYLGQEVETKHVIGFTTKSGFRLNKKVESLDEFWQIINTDKSIFARHRMYPTAFFQSWTIKTVKKWLDAGWFFRACKSDS